MRTHVVFAAGPLGALLLAGTAFAASVMLDSRPWNVGYDASDDRQHVTEFVLDGQVVENWNELFTRQILFDSDGKVPMDKLVELTRAGFGADCKNFKWSVLRQSDSEALYAWSHSGCTGHPPQHEISRLSRSPAGLCRWAYTSKRVPLAESDVTKYVAIVEKLSCD